MSSDDIIIKMENISKCFQTYSKPIDRLKQMLFGRFGRRYYRRFWALRNINFEIRKGECVGVIGKNGAGKSTLLQILVGTLAPTTGTVYTRGRIAALLELGSGFNPDFTGHDNIYMNASILGLPREEIDIRYQEIVDFANIGDFINEPVKTYSTGMIMRLAFAVQIMVNPDILIVDEALSVGDAAFQRKCFAHMEKLIKGGTTIFLVTHDTSSVKRFCQKCIFLKNGALDYIGDVEEGVTRYYQFLFPQSGESQTEENKELPREKSIEDGYCLEIKGAENEHKWGHGNGAISSIRIWGLEPGAKLETPGKMKIEISAAWDSAGLLQEITKQSLPENIVIGILISNKANIPVFGTNTMLDKIYISPYENSAAVVSFELDLPCLKPDDYFVTAAISLGDEKMYFDLQWQDACVQFTVGENVMQSCGGITFIPHETKVQKVPLADSDKKS